MKNFVLKFCIFTTCILYASQLFAKQTVPDGQLPETVEPTHYKLALTLNPEKSHFRGTAEISLKLSQKTDTIYLHAQDINFNSLQLVDSKSKQHAAKVEYTQVEGVIAVIPTSKLKAGKYQLIFDYSAPFNENLQGIYRVKDNGQYYAFSQMESIYARYAFPSFDEPRFKTTYDLTVTIPENLSAIANTPETALRVLTDGWKTITFKTSKPMPTYLFALAVGEFDIVDWPALPITEIRERQLPLRGVATKGKGDKLKYALENTQGILESLENYFQSEYPYEKLDILAVPDFAAGAMENPGAITYREQLLLLDDDSSISQKRSYKSVHAHELAHQWFGNLVTPEWWNDIWLNEAFATWMAATALHQAWPDEQWQRRQIKSSKNAMNSDSIPSARKVRNPIETNSDIITAFDGITYSKGGGVLSMVESFMGADNFRSGVQKYMHKYQWKNATAIDFFETIASVLPKQSAEEVVKSFRDFVEQAGVPLLNIQQSCEDERTYLDIQQERYTPLGTSYPDKTLWNIPACINYQVDGEVKQQCQVIAKQQQQVKLKISGCADWVMPNAQATGYYRFNLDTAGWKNLIENMDKLDPLEANAVIDSLNSSFDSGKLSLSDLLKVIPTTLTSSSWEVQVSGLEQFETLIEYADESEKAKLRTMAANIYRNATDQIGFIDNTQLDKINPIDANNLRWRLIDFMGNIAKDKKYRDELTRLAIAYTGFSGDEKLHDELLISALRTIAMGVAVEELGQPFVNLLLKHLSETSDGTLRGRFIEAMIESEDPKIAAQLIEYARSKDFRDNEKSRLVLKLVTESKLDAVMWPWLQKNFDSLVADFPTDMQKWLPYLFMNECSSRSVNRLDEFLQPRLGKLIGADRTFVKLKDRLKQCMAQKAHVKPQISQLVAQ